MTKRKEAIAYCLTLKDVYEECDPRWRDFWRQAYPSVLPAYHLNKEHWMCTELCVRGVLFLRRLLQGKWLTGALV